MITTIRNRWRPQGALSVTIGLLMIAGWFLYLRWLGGTVGFREPCDAASVLTNAQVQVFFPPGVRCYPDSAIENFSLTSLFTNFAGLAVTLAGVTLVVLGTLHLVMAARRSFRTMRNSRPSIFG